MDKKFAVFVDADNICARNYKPALREIRSTYGEILIKRVYGDWTTSNMNSWKDIMLKDPGTTVQQFRSGKNATDTRIIMDAVELMLQKDHVNAFCIISSDADFFGLALRLREHGKYVLGMGKEISSQIWQDACSKFVKLESINCDDCGVLLEAPKHFGLIKNDRGVFHFRRTDINGESKDMSEGSRVFFDILKEPDPSKPDRKDQRGRAVNVKLAA